jgi:hypothetical protein
MIFIGGKMTTITLDVPDELAKRLKNFDSAILIEILKKVSDHLVTESKSNTRSWQEDLNSLRQQIHDDGGLKISSNPDEMIETLRQARHEIFEEEYAHLY